MQPSLPLANAYWVIPGRFAAGAYPGGFQAEKTRQKIDRFLESGFTHFIDLTSPNELPPYHPILMEEAELYGVQVGWQRFPIGDFGLPTPSQMHAILDAIAGHLAAGRQIYVHCWGGIGRTGTTIGCYLVRQGMAPEAALRQVNTWCHYAHSPETPEQRAFILQWKNHESN